MIRQCCECKRIWLNGCWVHQVVAQLDQQNVSHGYCEECFIKQMQLIHRLGKMTDASVKKALNRYFF